MSLRSLGAVGAALSESVAVACGVRKVATFARGAEPKDRALLEVQHGYSLL